MNNYRCTRCTTLPSQYPERGLMVISLPIVETSNHITKYLDANTIEYSLSEENVLRVKYDIPSLVKMIDGCFSALSKRVLSETRCILLGEDDAIGLNSLDSVEDLQRVVAVMRGNELLQILAHNRLTTWFQPIVDANGNLYAHECLLRGLDDHDHAVSPAPLFAMATDANFLFTLDRLARITAIRNAAKRNLPEKIFINFSPNSIYEPEYCLRTTWAEIRKSNLKPENIVFEVVESEEIRDIDHLNRVLAEYRDNGFKIALDDVGAGYNSLQQIAGIHPDFVKIDMTLIRNVDKDGIRANIVASLIELSKKSGILTIAEGIETEAEYRWLIDNGIDYLQGYFIARPSADPTIPTISLES